VGSDDLFKKRKAKAAELSRRKPIRMLYEKVLIVCEGSKTEPLYFEELVDHYKIHGANVRVSGECGSDPVSVVQHGLQLYQDEKKSDSGPFDRVYCVIDKDAHQNYDEAMNLLANTKPNDAFFAANSVPCFEYWILLHFTYTTKPYMPCGGTSSGAAVLKELKTYWPQYTKAGRGAFEATLDVRNDELGYAKANAERALNEAKKNQCNNPSTHVHELVHYLQNIKTDMKP
jgi:RloB-like protein